MPLIARKSGKPLAEGGGKSTKSYDKEGEGMKKREIGMRRENVNEITPINRYTEKYVLHSSKCSLSQVNLVISYIRESINTLL